MAVKVCSNCGEANRENAFQCTVCNYSLKDAKLEGISNEEKRRLFGTNKPRNSICSHCGETIDAQSLKCKYCGNVNVKPTTGKAYYPQESNTGCGCSMILLFIATFLIPLVGLIVGGIFAFSDDPDKQDLGKMLLIFGIAMIVIGIIVGIIFI
ncbi:zinc ribbon domain-containing protein [Paenibacillus sp. J5C_2022]|uniref:double zinc ribbon domain-containing protein n=1 Tax=Paenibacillus sp. J5C2022 TaxID=2977129 RepID=UPI0021D0D31A|nr:zinc ribbon domain-containing protein [Paenibacillus sp. J5C2022]MCU6709020.1 zinc ribbon domain-containing protein [Paenibacillus sp. J5C2022]